MQVLVKGVWCELPYKLDTSGSDQEVNAKMIEQGYYPAGVEVGAIDHSMNSLRVWSSRSMIQQPNHVFQLCLGSVIIEFGADTFGDYMSLLEKSIAMVSQAAVVDFVGELVFGESDITDLLPRIRKALGNG